MIWGNDVNNRMNSLYEETVKNLEKAKEILNKRLANKEISDSEYIKKVKEIDEKIKKYKKDWLKSQLFYVNFGQKSILIVDFIYKIW